MKIGKGVEWAAHSCALLALLPANAALALEALADFIGVPSPYLAKQMQLLSKAGIVKAKRGVAGGYKLARLPETISLWDITGAIDGTTPSFRCTEIRQKGSCGASSDEVLTACKIAASFKHAEDKFRQELNNVKLPELVAGIAQDVSDQRKSRIKTWIEQNAAFST
ncbi:MULTISPECIES: RrF2 family transcriptional regulator [Pseudoalteromonas]|uniref:Rrf2 family transcriptional regulator n=1 Tax=Pseudoalteromonas obscura TaxID=3048491 RepID=A0ABT7EG83_9GAMM|nr:MULTISPECIES: Rrf2 family transcriptional regulator [Pseudoalteromonas]MBQ4838543.1 Rrf2 family transcriptional regulator [Pseudoalteromonas luteoviolacea]MDK2593586.1 Rrf2 family transcriptional regulator [Pseudoalteromonas sp. P94(2023)]